MLLRRMPVEERNQGSERPGGLVFVNTRKAIPREFYITKEDCEKHGYTRGCPGCSSFFRGAGKQPHSPECRERFREAMKDYKKVKESEERRREFERRQDEKKRKKEEKRERKEKGRRNLVMR